MGSTHSSASRHALYRFYGDSGDLLYVGITASPSGRFRKHGQDKNWWPQVRGITVEWYDDRESVLAAEARAIHVENPTYNVQRPMKRTRPATMLTPKPQRLSWACAYCGEDIADKAGYIYVEAAELYEAERAVELWEAANPGPMYNGGAFLTYPEPAQWRSKHTACAPEDTESYLIEVDRARSHAHLLSWTAHLMGKRWLEHTDWDDLIKTAAGVDA